MDDVRNPDRIQRRLDGRRSKCTSVVLIHDGGGTTFAYYMLHALDRDVYTIYDPNYATAQPWEGGLDGMAAHYLRLIKDAGLHGPLILGGWSLGGYIALAIARLIADDPCSPISVAGCLLVDTPYHIPLAQFPEECVEPDQSDLPRLTQKSLDRCDDLLDAWELPTWDSAPCGTRVLHCPQLGARYPSSIPPGHFVRESIHGEITVQEVAPEYPSRDLSPSDNPTPLLVPRGEYRYCEKHAAELAPAGLIRCVRRCINRDYRGCGALVDYFREDPLLGWATGGYPEFIKLVIDLDAHHYDMFALARVDATTSAIKQGLDALDSFMLPD
ncbi:hypothetical protein DL764_009886 [Monosporascus ibericus]|uniref:Thioesterase domain-containing protein n=1 Tax=Monosporascus ibericus TaxID=155417 RepID=A0A4Q4SWV7_9PEZI|nr:hypothetical protein DL764_009886 [Monosporascus ibericus]